jgi:predicted amidohydrolase
VELKLVAIRSFGRDRGKGNLLGIQPYMLTGDYASGERFHRKIDGYLSEARERGFIGDKTIVVLPEYLGAWLVTAGEKAAVRQAATTEKAALMAALSNLPSFPRWLAVSKEPDRARSALFRMKARSMARIYQRVFSGLARQYHVTLVAGSTILPAPEVRESVLAAGEGPLYNVSVVYGPEGRALPPVVKKAFLIEVERSFLKPGEVSEIPVFETPAGRLGVLICADSWHAEAYARMKEQRAELVAVPSYLFPDGAWTRKWHPAPADALRAKGAASGEAITEGEAWMEYALPGRMKESAARAGVNVFLRGRLWDLGSDGQSLAVLGDAIHKSPHVEGAAIINLWL